jgi:hypothetical protein
MGSLPVKDLGPCQVLYDSVDLGPTLGGVTFKEELHTKDIMEDGHGDTPVDAIFIGRIVTIECKFTRSSLTQLEAMIESSTKGASNLKVVNSVGNAMFADAEELILKPLVDNVASVTAAEWLHIHRAYPVASVELPYDNSGQRVVSVTFKAFPDDATGQVGEIWRMGPAS